MANYLLDRIGDLELFWLAVLAFFLPFAETVAFLDLLVPGEVGMVVVGAAAETPDRVLVVFVFVFGAVGAFCGDSVSWYVGHRWGVAVLSRFSPVWRRVEPALGRATAHFDRHGGRSVFFGRFVGALRAIVPLVAGAAGLPYRTFAPWNAAASVLWVGLIVSLGAAFGDDMADAVDQFSVALSIVVVAGLILWFAWRRRRSSGADPVRR